MTKRSGKRKSNQIALLLSGIQPGLGQFYNEDWLKGILFFVGFFFLLAFLLPESYLDILLMKVKMTGDLLFRLLMLGVFWGLSVYDADRSAKKKNAALSAL
ncbi:MAG: hypothetical protein HY282_16190 [Nitrospirae bacterium]|nr:hypothetical protein [Candidatus Manganitrophaceae bacterium]